MSEPTEPKKPKVFRPSPSMRAAMKESADRKRLGLPPEWRDIAAKHDVNPNSLRRFMWDWDRYPERFDMADAPGQVATRGEDMVRADEVKIECAVRLENYLTARWQRLLGRMETKTEEIYRLRKRSGNEERIAALEEELKPIEEECDTILKRLARARIYRNTVEKGNFDVLKEMHEMLAVREKRVALAEPTKVETIPVTAEVKQLASPVARAEQSMTARQAELAAALGEHGGAAAGA